jgi:hypothetical protein
MQDSVLTESGQEVGYAVLIGHFEIDTEENCSLQVMIQACLDFFDQSDLFCTA